MLTYTDLLQLSDRPDAYAEYTADTLWTEPHLAKMMLQMHLDQDTDLASRPKKAIDRVAAWMDQTLGLRGASVCDLGCGPGLYARRLADFGATVHGIDFSENSIRYARAHAGAVSDQVTFQVGDYLNDPLPDQQDILTLIYCDLCALSPAQRYLLLTKIIKALRPGGKFVFDVFSTKAFETVVDDMSFGHRLMDGFWSENDHFVFKHTFRYDDLAVSLDRYTVIEADRSWTVYNWLKYFKPDELIRELRDAGFDRAELVPGFGLDPSDETTFGVIAYV
ncbi:MAG: class I SAM-dependent methyltransferase [Pseudomonadota bacterium]